MTKLYTVDAFTDQPFRGNPAAVCVLDAFPAVSWMQHLAAEMNLSETAFLVHNGDHFGLRWFTPGDEVDLCGHATLAAAHVLWDQGICRAGESIIFETKSGRLGASLDDGWIQLDFPAEPPSHVTAPDVLNGALGIAPDQVLQNRMDLVAVLESERAVRSVQPDMGLIRTLPVRGVIVTAPSADDSFDFVSRFFAPRVGVPEDPVTGSAHCALAPYWSERLGRNELTGHQVSDRGGVLRTRLDGDRVLLFGKAVSMFAATLNDAAAPHPA